jgi:hypothetical protein
MADFIGTYWDDITEASSIANSDTAVLSGSKRVTASIIRDYTKATVLPNGSDDTNNLQVAINAASADESIILAGNYIVNGGLTVSTNGIKIIGLGATITQIQEGVSDGIKTITVTGDRVTIEGIHFIGKGTENPWDGSDPGQSGVPTAWNGVAAIYINTCDSTHIYNCRFTNHAGGTIAMTGVCTDILIESNYMAGMGSGYINTLDNGGDAAINTTGNTLAKHGIRVINNYITGHAFGMFGAAGSWIIKGNIIKDIPGQHGCYLVGNSELVLSNNIVINTAQDGLKAMQYSLAPDTDAVASVTDNVISDAGYFGISVLNLSTGYMRHVLVANNNIYNAGSNASADGLYIKGVKGALIEGNLINTTSQYGIYLRDAECTLINNKIEKTDRVPVFLWQSTGETMGPYKIDGLDLVDCPLNSGGSSTYLYRSVVAGSFVDSDANTNLYIGNVHHRWIHETPNVTYPPNNLIYINQNVDVKITGPLINESDLASYFPDSVSDEYNDIINVKTFGATGDGSTNDAVAIQKAIDAAGGKTVYFPTGTYIVNATLDIDGSSASSILYGENVTLDFSSATITNNTCLRFYGGAQTSVGSQTGDEVVGNNTWNISGHNLSVGDVVVVEDTANASYSGYSNDYHVKERFIVREVNDANNFETQQDAIFDWAAADETWTKMPGASPGLKGTITIIGRGRATAGDYCVVFENCTRPIIERGINMSGADIATLKLIECYGVHLSGLHILKELDDFATAECEALLIESCQDVRAEGCVLEGDYHGVQVGGVGLNVDIHFINCRLDGNKRWAADCDGNMCYSSFVNCDLNNGLRMGGDRNKVIGCDIPVEDISAQDAITLEELKGLNHRFERIYFSGLGTSKYAIFASNIPANCTEGGTCIVRDCFCDTPSGADSGIIFYFRTDGTGLSAATNYLFSGIRCSNYGTASNYGVYIYHTAGTFPARIDIYDCHFPGGLFIPNVTGKVSVRNVVIANASASAITSSNVSETIDVKDVTIDGLGSGNEAFILTGHVSTGSNRITVCDSNVMGAHDKLIRVQDTSLASINNVLYDTEPTTTIIFTDAEVDEFYCSNFHLKNPNKVNITSTTNHWDITTSGSPQGLLPGSIGSVVRDIHGGSGAIVYVKNLLNTTLGWETVSHV